MASSKCGKCDNETFEMKENVPKKWQLKVFLLQCTKCGAVAGVTDFFDAHAGIKSISQQIKELQSDIDGRLRRIEAALASRR